MDKTKLVLKNVPLIYVNEAGERKGKSYSRSLAVLVDDAETRDAITQWVKDNNIGSGDKAGTPYFGESEDGDVFYFWPNKNTEYTDSSGRDEYEFKDLVERSAISLVARAEAYDYTGKDGVHRKGVSHKLTSVIVMKAAKNIAKEDTAALLDELSNTSTDNKGTSEDVESYIGDVPF